MVSDVLPRMKNVTAMYVNHREDSATQSLWRICNPNAQYLPLDVDFPNLTELHIRTSVISHITGIMTQDLNLVPEFINKFQKTLTRLSISHYLHTTAIGIPTYDSLVRFPNLISVTLEPGSRGYAGFIKQHADSLLELQCPIDSFPDGIGPIQFRRLKKVTLTFDALVMSHPESSWWMSSSPFLTSILPTVRRLRLSGDWYKDQEIGAFLQTVARLSVNAECGLAELAVVLRIGSIDLLPAIASTFPKLRSLEITFADIISSRDRLIQPDRMYPFEEGYIAAAKWMICILSRVNVPWGLEDITITCRGGPVDIPMWGMMYICGRFIPSISSFNSTGNKIIPEDVEIPYKFMDTLCTDYNSSSAAGE
ncbi:hypothetical protein FA15DRAFT_708154 [Coprinopsis marcescibilis]|uniref:F-box domain-containing protein n=1 Tax=Coprinopsis marcescibilis TaxID=230819 RepID=A0A5C3KWU9_COPMA|nr:hypothetical protein FA15DRAFT_708154 [Coprinopsis marcescibilis]